MKELSRRERMTRAARGEPVDRPPVWLMRQAGRYLPEYREIRSRVGFLEMCRDPDLAARVSLQPYRRFGVDGIVVFSDILLPLTGLGLELGFHPGPAVENPVEKAADLVRLEGDPAASVEPTCEAIRRIRSETAGEACVIGFAGAPWTLAAYASERKLSRDLVTLTTLSYREPSFVDDLLDRMAEVTRAALHAQIEAGADLLQIFDTWAGVLDPARFERLAGRAIRRVLDGLPRERPPIVLYARGASHLLEPLADLGPDVVSVDWRVPLAEAARRVGARVSLQGNLDPGALCLPPEQIEEKVEELVTAGRAARGHIVNLGHGVQPHTPVEGVAAFVRAAQRARPATGLSGGADRAPARR
jgi:uroporphyrinogen decarboxylase